MDVYLDLVMLLNFFVHFLLLLAAGWLSGGYHFSWRTFLAAGLGSVHAGLCLLPGLYFLGNRLWRFVCLAAMAFIAFGFHKKTIFRSFFLLLLSMTLGVIAHIIGKADDFAILLSSVVLFGLCYMAFCDHREGQEYATVHVCHKEKRVVLTALVDTGNMLRDPVTGHPVLVVDSLAANKLLDLTEEELMHPIETISRGKYPGLRLIPYCSVGQPAGLLLCLRVDGLRINGKISNQIVAFAPQRIGMGDGYEALLGGVI